MDPNTLNLLGAVFGVFGSVAGAVAAIVGLLNRVTNRRAAASAKAAADAGTTTNASIEAMKKRTDDLLAAFLRDQSQELRLRRIEQYLADHEADKRAVHAARTTSEGDPA